MPKVSTSKFRQQLFNTPEYKEWRLAVLTRDAGLCRWCDTKEIINRERLEVHHIIPVSTNHELIFDVDNGITLCKKCHKKVQNKEDKFAEFFFSLLGKQLNYEPSSCIKRVDIDLYLALDLYLICGYSLRQIGERFNCAGETIRKQLDNLGLDVDNLISLPKIRTQNFKDKSLKLTYSLDPKICKCCGEPIPYKKKNNTYCSPKCQFEDSDAWRNDDFERTPNSGSFTKEMWDVQNIGKTSQRSRKSIGPIVKRKNKLNEPESKCRSSMKTKYS